MHDARWLPLNTGTLELKKYEVSESGLVRDVETKALVQNEVKGTIKPHIEIEGHYWNPQVLTKFVFAYWENPPDPATPTDELYKRSIKAKQTRANNPR